MFGRKVIMFVLFFGVIFCTILLCCCNSKYSKPYSAQKTAEYLSKFYNIEIETLDQEIIKQPPYGSVRYTFKKMPENFTFTAVVSVDRVYNRAFLFPVSPLNIDDNYLSAFLLYYKQKTLEIAEKYKINIKTVENVKDRPEIKVYIHDSDQLKGVVEMYFELKKLYNFKFSDSYYHPDFSVYYLQEEAKETDDSRIFWYRWAYHDPNKSADFLTDLMGQWNAAYDENDKV